MKKEIKYCRKSELLTSKIDKETVMMHQESGKYFALNAVASRIWDILEKPVSEAEIVKILLREFEVTNEQCTKEVNSFIAELCKKKLISID